MSKVPLTPPSYRDNRTDGSDIATGISARAEGAKALELRMSNDVHLKPPGDPAAGILRRR
ncbi:MAG TPA: hypothetical protein VEI03_08495 [Stellaceae bacterium]|nr:hypothetical protein [Stellaceae bacterium]